MEPDRLKEKHVVTRSCRLFAGEKRRRQKKNKIKNKYSRRIQTGRRKEGRRRGGGAEPRVMGDFYLVHLSVTSISSGAEVREQPSLIKISEQSHACRCLPLGLLFLCVCVCVRKHQPRQIAASTSCAGLIQSLPFESPSICA